MIRTEVQYTRFLRSFTKMIFIIRNLQECNAISVISLNKRLRDVIIFTQNIVVAVTREINECINGRQYNTLWVDKNALFGIATVHIVLLNSTFNYVRHLV